jgi:hypothetical protein
LPTWKQSRTPAAAVNGFGGMNRFGPAVDAAYGTP